MREDPLFPALPPDGEGDTDRQLLFLPPQSKQTSEKPLPDLDSSSLGGQVAALEREVARLRQAETALQQSNDALLLLSETANELLSSDRPQAVINTLFEKLAARLGLETYFNYLVDEEKGRLHLNSYAGIPPETAREIEWLDYGQAVCGCVARDAAKIVAEDIQQSDDTRTDLVRSFGVSAYACHPLMAHDRVIGTFSFGTSRKAHFEPHELALMQAVCDQVSLAMERTGLISERRRRELDQRLLADASAVLGVELDYEVTLANFAPLLATTLADWCVVDVGEAGKSLRYVGVTDISLNKQQMLADLRGQELLAFDEVHSLQRVAESGQAEIYADLAEPGALAAFAGNLRQQRRLKDLGAASAIVVPLPGRSGTLGTLTLVTTASGRHFGQDDLALARELASRAGVAIDNARLFTAAREAVEVRDEFLSAAAHELKTPLTSLRGFAQAMVRQFEQGKAFDVARLTRSLQVIDRQSDRLAQLISQLLDLSQIDSGELVLTSQRLEVGELARRVVEGAAIAYPRHRLLLHVHEPVWVDADPVRLEQVLRNLLDNAARFSPTGSKVDVDVWNPDLGTVKLAVRDRGAGIPAEHRAHVFDRFYRVNNGDRAAGIGLGLHISRHIIALHGGSIEVEAPEDGGTRFVISLPTVMAEFKRQREMGMGGD